jgi:uncharacterized protein (TIGR00369 family)
MASTSLLNLSELQAIVDRSPFNRFLGMKAESIDDEKLVLSIHWREELISSPERQSTHGGVLAAMVDACCDYVIAARIGRAIPTVDLRVDYHRAATPGDLKVEARIVQLGSTLATAEARIHDLNGRLIASGKGVYLTAEAKTAKA